MTRSLDERPDHYWFARHSTSIIFLIGVLTVIGVYEALTLPVAVFPTTNFPRIIIGVDNGVMPIEQMEVSITRPLEEAVRVVPGLQDVRSVTSRGSAEINLFFDWRADMLEALQMVDAAVSRVQSTRPRKPSRTSLGRYPEWSRWAWVTTTASSVAGSGPSGSQLRRRSSASPW